MTCSIKKYREKGVKLNYFYYALFTVGLIAICITCTVGVILDYQIKTEVKSKIFNITEFIHGNNTNKIFLAENSCGNVLLKLLSEDLEKSINSELKKIQLINYQHSSGYINTIAQLEFKLSDGSEDVVWYNIQLVKLEGTWKIFSISEVNNVPTIKSKLYLTKRDRLEEKEAEAIIDNWAKEMSKDRKKAIAKYTVGNARLLFEMDMEKEKGTFNIHNISAKLIANDGKISRHHIYYESDNSTIANNLVTFYKTYEGWKIVDIISIQEAPDNIIKSWNKENDKESEQIGPE